MYVRIHDSVQNESKNERPDANNICVRIHANMSTQVKGQQSVFEDP